MNISEKNFCLFNFAMQIAKSVLWKYQKGILKIIQTNCIPTRIIKETISLLLPLE